MNISCKCNRHRMPRGTVLVVHDDDVEVEWHNTTTCNRRDEDGAPQPLEPVQRTAKLRVLD